MLAVELLPCHNPSITFIINDEQVWAFSYYMLQAMVMVLTLRPGLQQGLGLVMALPLGQGQQLGIEQ